ncbi:MAG TPA: SPFH domain-containing protein [Kineosporiaceae bacterium]|nr:SPFH domain-containing protein [Kineosporiaceae bacterium]
MGLVDKLRGEFIDIVEWLDDSRDTIVWRFPRFDNEIKMGAKLIVRESQTAVFVNEGQIADAFTPGTYTLQTQNLPILSTLKGWKYGFNSPFKAEVYFVNTRQFTDMKWGTQNPIIVRDAEFGAVRLRAFGAYAVRVVDAQKLLKELVGTDPQFRTEEVQEYLRQMIVSGLGPALATSGVGILDMAANQATIGKRIAGVLSEDLANVGLNVPTFLIENISMPPEVEEALDKRTQLGILGNDLNRYTQLQSANAIEDAAKNPGGGAGSGIGLGMGMAIGQQMAQQLGQQGQQSQQSQQGQAPSAAAASGAPAGPPPLPAAWYLGVGGQQQGPFDAAGLAAAARSGTLTASTLVWRAGMAAWTPAAQVPEVSEVLGSVPPPLPPA